MNNLSGLIKNIASGDNDAMAELYSIMSKEIYVFLLMFCKDKYTAEDIMQETFIEIYENARSYKVFNNPRAWILTIAKNKAINVIRKNSRTTSLDNPETEALKIENTENIILDKMQVDELFSVLFEEDKKIVVLHAVYGFKHREIAEMVNLPLGTVTWLYKQSIAKMKQKDKESEDSGKVFIKPNKQKEVLINEK